MDRGFLSRDYRMKIKVKTYTQQENVNTDTYSVGSLYQPCYEVVVVVVLFQ